MKNDKYKYLIIAFNKHIKKLEDLAKQDPELAKKEAFESLKRIGIVDEQGELKPPYNGENVNEDDFTRGPQLTKIL